MGQLITLDVLILMNVKLLISVVLVLAVLTLKVATYVMTNPPHFQFFHQQQTVPVLAVSVIMLIVMPKSKWIVAVPFVNCHAQMAIKSVIQQSPVSKLANSRNKDGELAKRNLPKMPKSAAVPFPVSVVSITLTLTLVSAATTFSTAIPTSPSVSHLVLAVERPHQRSSSVRTANSTPAVSLVVNQKSHAR